MSDNPVRPSAIPLTPLTPIAPIKPIGPLTPSRLPIDPQLLSPSIRLVDLSGKTPQANLVVFLSYTSADGSERVARLAMPANGIISPASGSAPEFLSRVRVFAPPADLVLDQAFAAGHVFLGVTTLTVRENPPNLALRLGTVVPFQLMHRTPMTLLQNPMGTLPQITGLRTTGRPGSPSLPIEVHRILIPPGLEVSSVEALPDPSPTRVPAPAPQIQPPMVVDSPLRQKVSLTRMLPAAPPTVGIFPPSPVKLQRVEHHPWGAIATVTLSPVQYDAGTRQYVHQPNVGYHLTTKTQETYKLDNAQPLFPGLNNSDRVGFIMNALKAINVSVLGAGPQVWMIDPASLLSKAPCGMVIITDDTTWTGTSANPPWLSAAAPTAGAANQGMKGIIAQFERLAYWKSSRGMRTKVVPVSTIVAMHNAGDLKPFQQVPALDLPEIIRSFILYAQKKWQTDYVLLGGSQAIIPSRKVLAPLGPDNWRASTGDGSTVTVSVTGPNNRMAKITGGDGNTDASDRSVAINSSMVLLCNGSNITVPFSSDGKGFRGWFFTTANDFAKKSSGFTILQAQEDPTFAKPLTVIVFGGLEIDDDFRWIFPEAASETDYYYSDTTRALPGGHDWDNNGNLILGQVMPSDDGEDVVDGMSTTGAVCVGRAPVTSATEARNFVDKVLSYEQVCKVDAGAIDLYQLGRVTLFSDNWQHPWVFSQSLFTATKDQTEPKAEQYMWSGSGVNCRLDTNDGFADAMQHTLISSVPDFALQALMEDTTKVIDIPYDNTGAKTTCWYFCDCTWTRLKPTPGALGQCFVRVQNPPAGFTTLFWQYKSIDASTVQKQRVRALWQSLVPEFGDIRRIYRDFEKFPGEPVDPMLKKVVNTMMSQGTHFLSIAGHGNSYYVGELDTATDAACTNAGKPYITYAHSCLTADPRGNPGLGEALVKQQYGALAYVGYIRSCWTSDDVANYELGFWCALRAFRRLGHPIAQHVNIGGWQNFAHIFMMTLYGDPEMPVWTAIPTSLQVTFEYHIVPDGMMKGLESVQVTAMDGNKPVSGLDVTVLQGWKSSLQDPVWHFHTTTDDNGSAIAWIRSPRKESMRIVVSAPVKGSDQPLYIPAIKDYTATQKS